MKDVQAKIKRKLRFLFFVVVVPQKKINAHENLSQNGTANFK